LFYEAALEVLAPFPEARQEVERRIGVNEPCIFRPDWQRTVTGDDARFYFCKETLWAALENLPEARQALDQALVEAFGGKGSDGGESPVESDPSPGNAGGGCTPDAAGPSPRQT
jgi:hypothetical protein